MTSVFQSWTRLAAPLALGLGALAASQARASGYQVSVRTDPQAAGGGVSICSYNYGGGVGGGCDLQGNGAGSVSPDSPNGAATAATAGGQVDGASTQSFYVPPGLYATGAASANLKTASLSLSATDTGINNGYAGFASNNDFAGLSDTLTYTVAGATAATVTTVDLTFTIAGSMQPTGTATDGNSSGELSGSFTFLGGNASFGHDGGDASFDFQNNAATGFATVAGLGTYPSAYPGSWTTNADGTVSTFTTTYQLDGASGTLALGADATLDCSVGMTCDDSNLKIGLSGPAGFSYASASGVFLSGAPEPAVWTMMLLGLGAAGLALRRRRAATIWRPSPIGGAAATAPTRPGVAAC